MGFKLLLYVVYVATVLTYDRAFVGLNSFLTLYEKNALFLESAPSQLVNFYYRRHGIADFSAAQVYVHATIRMFNLSIDSDTLYLCINDSRIHQAFGLMSFSYSITPWSFRSHLLKDRGAFKVHEPN